jgi:hypothetical protein
MNDELGEDPNRQATFWIHQKHHAKCKRMGMSNCVSWLDGDYLVKDFDFSKFEE